MTADPYADVPPPSEPPDDGAVAARVHDDDHLLRDIFTAKWLGGETFPDIEFVIEDLITEGANILVAAPKAGKSWMANSIALACAQGEIVLGAIPVKQRRVLYLALEDGKRRLQKRLRGINGTTELPDTLDLMLMVDPKDAADLIEAYLRRHRCLHPGDSPPLIIIDTFGKIKRDKPAGSEPYLHDYRSGAALKAAIETLSGAALLLIHHDRKAESVDYVDAVSGTHGVAGAMDTILVLARERGSDNAVLKVTGRDIPEGEYALTADRSTGAVIWSLAGADLDAAKEQADRNRAEHATKRRLGDRSLDAVKFISSREETTPGDLAGHLSISAKSAGDLLRDLFEREYISKSRRGVYGPHLSVENTPESPESPESAGQK